MKKESTIERLLRQVYGCNTEAGDRLRYHYTRAVACPEYLLELGYSSDPRISWEQPSREVFPSQDLLGFFIFQNTKEGHDYWYDIVYMLEEKER